MLVMSLAVVTGQWSLRTVRPTMESCRSLTLLTLSLTLVLSLGEVIKTQQCHKAANAEPTCKVHEVRVTPCNPGDLGVACKLALGTPATLEFDYTPNFNATRMGTVAEKTGTLLDIPFAQMDTDGCKTTTCPVEAGKMQTYKYNLDIGTNTSQFPAVIHEIKWRLWNEDDHHQKCCFKFKLRLFPN